MAELYLAVATGVRGFAKLVVLKRIRPGLSTRADVRGMLLDEARLAARFGHRNLVDVLELAEFDNDPFYVMRYVPGADLRAVLGALRRRNAEMPLPLATLVTTEVAAGLHHAHELRDGHGRSLGVVHRDVSTANIRLGLGGEVTLLDFGVAKSHAQNTFTRAGTSKGNAAYMAPEQCRGERVDRRTDVFALGIVLYEMVTMRRLFAGGDALTSMSRVLHEPIVPPRAIRPEVPTALEAIVIRALEREPRHRFPSAQAMGDALEQVARDEGWCANSSMLAQLLGALFEIPELPADPVRERDDQRYESESQAAQELPTTLEPSWTGTSLYGDHISDETTTPMHRVPDRR